MPETFRKYVLATMPALPSTLHRTTQTLHHMHAEIPSFRVLKAHRDVAFLAATHYLNDLRRDTDATLGTLAGRINEWRHGYGVIIRARRVRSRFDLLERLAKESIKRRLENEPELAAKLIAIRAEQDRRRAN